jgi:type IV secretory pathway VirB10-like protein
LHCRKETKSICIAEIIEDTIPERPEEEEEEAGDNTEALIDQVEKEVDDDFARLEEDIVQEAEKREGANKENREEMDNKKEDREEAGKDVEEQDEDAKNKHEEQTENQENAVEDRRKDDSTMGENPGNEEEENNNNEDDTFLLTGSHIVDNVSSNMKNDVDHNGNVEQYVQS